MTSVPARLAAFAAILAVLFAGGALAGSIVESGEDGLRLDVARASYPAARETALRFRIAGDEGRAVRDFELEQTKRMHLIVVRRDLTGFQHLHPTMAADGTWSTPVRFATAGTYRVFADFKRDGEAQTLGRDVSVPGTFAARPLPAPSDRAVTADGYEVALAESGHETVFSVRKDGQPVNDIEPYLGARGHLVALREGDLAYLHVHPTSAATVGRDIRFVVEYPSSGRYRLFLQFRHAGRVHTAALTQDAGKAKKEADDEHGH